MDAVPIRCLPAGASRPEVPGTGSSCGCSARRGRTVWVQSSSATRLPELKSGVVLNASTYMQRRHGDAARGGEVFEPLELVGGTRQGHPCRSHSRTAPLSAIRPPVAAMTVTSPGCDRAAHPGERRKLSGRIRTAQ